jgi:hypothetical protein
VNTPHRGKNSPLGAKFTTRGEVNPWGLGVKLIMALGGRFLNIRVKFRKFST